jgi:hypothetical protein
MGDIVQTSDLKTALRITVSTYDAELAQLIARVEGRFQGEIGQNLATATYTSQRYTGDGQSFLQLRQYPLQTLASIAIEDESAITVSDEDVIRYTTGTGSDGVLYLMTRLWTKGKINNITATYDAGYEASTIATDIADVWALLLDAASDLWYDADQKRQGIKAQSHMSGAVTYFTEGSRNSDWYNYSWLPVVQKYMRRHAAAVT